MPNSKKSKFVPYRTPANVRPGTYLTCEVRGVVKVVGLSAAKIPWPVGERGRKQALIVYRSLARAIRSESPEAVAELFGVTIQQVASWKRRLPKSDRPVPRKSEKCKSRFKPVAPRPWSPQETAMLGTVPIDEIAARTGRTLGSVKRKVKDWLQIVPTLIVRRSG